jgi:hypothetical protein
LGSKEKIGKKFREIPKKPKFTPPSLMKATPTGFASNTNDTSLTSFSNDDDFSVMSLGQNEEVHVNYSTHPPEGKTTAVVAVMMGKPKDGYHCHRSNKH